MQIQESRQYRVALHHLGFRPFFLLGGVFAVLLVATWFWILHYRGVLPVAATLTALSWHAHEMLFGYAMAVIAGFLLTAVRNWTGLQTLHGAPLLALALLWLLARCMPYTDWQYALTAMAALDLGFALWLSLAILQPLWKARQWQHLGVWGLLVLLGLANSLFYHGLLGNDPHLVQQGLYSGLYLVLAMIMLMGRRVIPFFIEKGVGYPVTLRNYRWLDISILPLMAGFILADVFLALPGIADGLAALLAVLHGIRLAGWYTHGTWRKPLLWILYLGYAWFVIGFAMQALAGVTALNPMLAVHALAYGVIGLMTIGMMARVALGHTGRDVFNPPRILQAMFALLVLGSVVRVLLPMLVTQHYALLLAASQLAWLAAFTLFALVYIPMLIKPRIDGSYG